MKDDGAATVNEPLDEPIPKNSICPAEVLAFPVNTEACVLKFPPVSTSATFTDPLVKLTWVAIGVVWALRTAQTANERERERERERDGPHGFQRFSFR
jgi:hypothetical protein